MTRYFLSLCTLFVCLACLPGCGSGGGDAKFDPKAAGEITAEEQAEIDAYNEELENAEAPAEYGS